jgi:hypothetical protein
MTPVTKDLEHARTKAAFRAIRVLVSCYLAISLAAVVVLAVLHDHPSAATQDAWVHGIIVAVTAVLMMTFALRTTGGNASAYRRLRIASGVMLAAIVVITVIPGDFPLWMKLEGGLCGLLLLGVVIVVNGKHLRKVFSPA